MNDFGQSLPSHFHNLRNNNNNNNKNNKNNNNNNNDNNNSNNNSLMVIPQSGSHITIPMLKSKYKGEINNLTLAICHIRDSTSL